MAAAISGSMLSDGLGATVSPSCTTGNCTWPTYTTLGVCSSCRDVSHTFITNSTCLVREQDLVDADPPFYTNRHLSCDIEFQDRSEIIGEALGLNISTAEGKEMYANQSFAFEGVHYPLASITSIFLAGDSAVYYPPVYAT